ncbi:hypothetical protein kpS2_28 [Klebsiella phage KpS2]|nr:hypothetical protein [Klebsiella phage vB_KpnP_cmc356ctg2]WQZ00572.1 hypothetical protein [Klebsiella phage vB_KpnS-K7]
MTIPGASQKVLSVVGQKMSEIYVRFSKMHLTWFFPYIS